MPSGIGSKNKDLRLEYTEEGGAFKTTQARAAATRIQRTEVRFQRPRARTALSGNPRKYKGCTEPDLAGIQNLTKKSKSAWATRAAIKSARPSWTTTGSRPLLHPQEGWPIPPLPPRRLKVIYRRRGCGGRPSNPRRKLVFIILRPRKISFKIISLPGVSHRIKRNVCTPCITPIKTGRNLRRRTSTKVETRIVIYGWRGLGLPRPTTAGTGGGV